MRFNLENTVAGDPESAKRFNEVADNLDQIQTAIQAQINAAQAQFEKTFSDLVKDFFAAVPQIKSVTWTQYSPHFNDGDACTFSVHEVFFATDANENYGYYRDEEDEDDEEEDDGSVKPEFFSGCTYSLRQQTFLTPEQIKMCEKLDSLISCNEDTMESMFGNGYMIVLRPEGKEVRYYEHD